MNGLLPQVLVRSLQPTIWNVKSRKAKNRLFTKIELNTEIAKRGASVCLWEGRIQDVGDKGFFLVKYLVKLFDC